MPTRKPQPSPELLAAVDRFAKAHGRTWKQALRRLWASASGSPELMRLRNQYGPTWLTAYRPGGASTRKPAKGPQKARTSAPSRFYEVVVDNVGTVHSGRSLAAARREFAEYVKLSKAGRGRAGGERVILYADNEPIREHD